MFGYYQLVVESDSILAIQLINSTTRATHQGTP
ncbi:hypothetical protein LINGRAHAP2_LOCUS9757 [Linum grandiflorum]